MEMTCASAIQPVCIQVTSAQRLFMPQIPLSLFPSACLSPAKQIINKSTHPPFACMHVQYTHAHTLSLSLCLGNNTHTHRSVTQPPLP